MISAKCPVDELPILNEKTWNSTALIKNRPGRLFQLQLSDHYDGPPKRNADFSIVCARAPGPIDIGKSNLVH